jgi:hypothetical protein
MQTTEVDIMSDLVHTEPSYEQALDREAVSPLESSACIWSTSCEDWRDSYLCFRKTFVLEASPKNASLVIAADSDFVAYLNEREIGRGQFSDFAQEKTWSEFPVGDALRSGSNVLAILVFHRGEDFLDHQTGTPGLIAKIAVGTETVVETDESWKAIRHPAFRQGAKLRMTSQCGFTFEYDARHETPWTRLTHDDTSWAETKPHDGLAGSLPWLEISRRPLPPLQVGELAPLKIILQGSYRQTRQDLSAADSITTAFLKAESFPWMVFANEEVHLSKDGKRWNAGQFLNGHLADPLLVTAPEADADGRFFIADLGAEYVGCLEFTVEAAPGTVLDIAHGEHLDDGRVRAAVGGRQFADRYICGRGVKKFHMPFRRLGARYLQVHTSGAIKLHAFGLRTTRHAGKVQGSFHTHDVLSNRLHDMSVRTLDLCRHEHYEDCPWREQALYGFDSRLQALMGYYAFGDYEFPRVSFSILGRSSTASGFLSLTAPGKWPTTIPSFSFAWVVAVAEYWLYSGESALFDEHRAVLDALIAKGMSNFDQERGIYRSPGDSELWHFYEWTPGLAGEFDRKSHYGAPYNLYLKEAMRSYAWMLRQGGDILKAADIEERISDLGQAIHRNFWNPNGDCYCNILDGEEKKGRSELTQILALCEQIVPEELQAGLVDDLIERRFVPCMLSAAYYRLKASLAGGRKARAWTDSLLCETWSTMAFTGSSTMWETEGGAADFDYAGSLCHGWSALPIYYHQAVNLGITPISPGFSEFEIAIYPSRLYAAEGKVPTPHGSISISWRKESLGLSIEATGPIECIPHLRGLPEAPILSASYNGEKLTPSHF